MEYSDTLTSFQKAFTSEAQVIEFGSLRITFLTGKKLVVRRTNQYINAIYDYFYFMDNKTLKSVEIHSLEDRRCADIFLSIMGIRPDTEGKVSKVVGLTSLPADVEYFKMPSRRPARVAFLVTTPSSATLVVFVIARGALQSRVFQEELTRSLSIEGL